MIFINLQRKISHLVLKHHLEICRCTYNVICFSIMVSDTMKFYYIYIHNWGKGINNSTDENFVEIQDVQLLNIIKTFILFYFLL